METQFKNAARAVNAKTAASTSKYIALVERAYEAENKPQGYNGTVASLVWGGFARMSTTRQTWRRATFKSLLIQLHNQGCFRILRSPAHMDALVNVSTFGLKMIRPVGTWKRPSFEVDEQLEDLIDHCFATYPTPVFLITAFYEGSLSKMLWYVKLGQGASVKELSGFPAHFTARMTHEFRNTPRGFDVPQALIRSQALGFGASEQVANTLAYTSLRSKEGKEIFWSGVVQFFAKAENKNLNDFRIIIDYLEFAVGRNRNFSIKGRTFASLTRAAMAWAAYTAKMNAKASQVMWYPSGIAPFFLERDQDGVRVTYEIVELTTADDLYEEGQDMNHCVADYVDACMAGHSAIFSLRKTVNESRRKLATIEVLPKMMDIEQVEGNGNSTMTNEIHAVVSTWSKQAALGFDWYAPGEVPQHYDVARGNPPAAVRDIEIPWTIIFWLTWVVIRVLVALN